MQRCQFWCGYKIKIQIFNCQISPGLTQPVNQVASTTVLTEVGIILNRYFGHSNLKIFKKQHSFLYHLLFSRVSKPSPLYSFSLDVPLIAPIIANAVLHWTESSFWWNKAFYVWWYMMIYDVTIVEMKSNKKLINSK